MPRPSEDPTLIVLPKPTGCPVRGSVGRSEKPLVCDPVEGDGPVPVSNPGQNPEP